MATDPKRRQKALAKKTAKRKAKNAVAGAARRIPTLASARLATLPIHECLVPDGLFEKGIGTVLVSRQMPNGDIVTGGFLVDAWCLGVKNALLRIDTEARYEDWVENLLIRQDDLAEVEPTYAKKLILDAIAYARELGFPPHPDYRAAARILEGIDAAKCAARFSFGCEGKPFFASGPNDTPARCREILTTLEKRLGPDGFQFTVAGRSADEFHKMGFSKLHLERLGVATVRLPVGTDTDPDDD